MDEDAEEITEGEDDAGEIAEGDEVAGEIAEEQIAEETVASADEEEEGEAPCNRDAQIPAGSEHLYDGVTYENEVLPTQEHELHALYKLHDSACRRVRFHMREIGVRAHRLEPQRRVQGWCDGEGASIDAPRPRWHPQRRIGVLLLTRRLLVRGRCGAAAWRI